MQFSLHGPICHPLFDPRKYVPREGWVAYNTCSVDQLSLEENPLREALSSPFCRLRNWDLENCRQFYQVKQSIDKQNLHLGLWPSNLRLLPVSSFLSLGLECGGHSSAVLEMEEKRTESKTHDQKKQRVDDAIKEVLVLLIVPKSSIIRKSFLKVREVIPSLSI